ncbi:MAG: hypothetical protein AB7Q81_17740 [Gammaproteobacteria bacterium]
MEFTIVPDRTTSADGICHLTVYDADRHPVERLPVVRIARITATPPGEAPEVVREAWVGLALPVVGHYAATDGAHDSPPSGVLSGAPESYSDDGGQSVPALAAFAVLHAAAPEAAQWWRTNTPELHAPGHNLVFPDRVCELLPNHESLATALATQFPIPDEYRPRTEELRLHVQRLDPEDDNAEEQRDLDAMAITPALAGYRSGSLTLMATFTSKNDAVVAAATAIGLEHPQSPALMYVNYVGADPPYHESGLEPILVQALLDAARREKIDRMALHPDVEGKVGNVLRAHVERLSQGDTEVSQLPGRQGGREPPSPTGLRRRLSWWEIVLGAGFVAYLVYRKMADAGL